MELNYKNLHIIGTSHISPMSLTQVESFVLNRKPEIIALELDRGRLGSLLHEGEKRKFRIKDSGVKGYLFALLVSYVESKLGKLTGVTPGSEMKIAYESARKTGAKVRLIDQDIRVTLRRLKITWKEKLNFVYDLISGGFSYLFGKGEAIEFDLNKVPPEKLIETLTEKVKKRYPSIYRVLIEERNQHMAKKLFILMRKNPGSQILAVVGAGHGREMLEIIKTLDSS
jgi:pheromone shutdown-related protein TraB